MLDIKRIKENPDAVKAGLKAKEMDCDAVIDRILALDEQRRTLITSSALVIPGTIMSESMLSYLGIVNLGGSSGTSLGTLLSDASAIWINYPHLMLYPALVISLLMICFNLFGNGLRDAFNPTLRGSEE